MDHSLDLGVTFLKDPPAQMIGILEDDTNGLAMAKLVPRPILFSVLGFCPPPTKKKKKKVKKVAIDSKIWIIQINQATPNSIKLKFYSMIIFMNYD